MNSEIARLHATVTADTRQAERNLKDFKGDLSGTASEAKNTGGALGGLTKVAMGLGGALIASEVFEYAKQLHAMGDASLKAEKGLAAVAGGVEAAEKITAAVKAGSSGLLTEMDAQLQATRLLSLGIAGTAEEAGRFTEVAATLGAVIGQDATTSMEQLSLAIANMSYERLDALGISAGAVRERVKELKEEGMGTEEAFRFATLEIATGKLNDLQAAGFEAGTALDRVKINALDAAAALGEDLAVGLEEAAVAFEEYKWVVDGLDGTYIAVIEHGRQTGEAVRGLIGLNYEAAEAARVTMEAEKLHAIALGNVQVAIDALPTRNATLETHMLAEAFLEAGRMAGYTDYQLINLWVTTGGTAEEMAFLYDNSITIPPAMAAIEGSSYGAANGLNTAAAGARNLKDAIDELNNTRTGDYGTSASAMKLNTQYGMQEALGNRNAIRAGADEYFEQTRASVISTANREMELMSGYWNEFHNPTPVRGGGGGGGARGAGRATGGGAAREFADGVTEGLTEGLKTTDKAGIEEAVTAWLTDQVNINEMRDELKKELGDTMGATGAQIDMALTDLFGLRASPIDTLVDSMATAADAKAQDIADVGAAFGTHLEDGINTRFSGIGDRLVTYVLGKITSEIEGGAA